MTVRPEVVSSRDDATGLSVLFQGDAVGYSFERAGRFRKSLHLSSNDTLTPADFDAAAARRGVAPLQVAKVEPARSQVTATHFPEGFKVDGIGTG